MYKAVNVTAHKHSLWVYLAVACVLTDSDSFTCAEWFVNFTIYKYAPASFTLGAFGGVHNGNGGCVHAAVACDLTAIRLPAQGCTEHQCIPMWGNMVLVRDMDSYAQCEYDLNVIVLLYKCIHYTTPGLHVLEIKHIFCCSPYFVVLSYFLI